MQRFGPPPSYPTLRIPGLNAPIPEGAQWGFHPGGWGKPPLDEYNRPLYGDVFGVLPKHADSGVRFTLREDHDVSYALPFSLASLSRKHCGVNLSLKKVRQSTVDTHIAAYMLCR